MTFPSRQLSLLLVSLALVSTGKAETVSNLTSWTVQGAVQMDPSKPGPDGTPSIKIGPGAKAELKLRADDGSGKLTLYVYDDGTVSSPDQKKSVGPRWGFTEASGRILVGGIVYAHFFPPAGSLGLIDTDPKAAGPWSAMKFAGARKPNAWTKWEFDYLPDAGLQIKIDDQPLPARDFDWKTSQADGFNGLILYGDGTGSATPQTLWIGGLAYELGAPMTVKPGSAPAAPAATGTASAAPSASAPAYAAATLPPSNLPAPAADTPGSSVPAPLASSPAASMPGATLADDLKTTSVVPLPGYLAHHPRLLFSASDRAALQQKAKDHPQLWDAVLESARGLASVPTPEAITIGTKYWRIHSVESGALAWFVTGDAKYAADTARWMTTYCQQAVWGTGFRDNKDLQASWNLFYISVAYDTLYSQLSDADRKTIRDGLAAHAKVLYDSFDPADPERNGKFTYDQNHLYNPAVALAAAALVLYGDVPDAAQWLNRAHAVMQRSRYVQNEDGYYYEGFGYWEYALHWHARYADLMARATGENLYQLPALRDDWLFALYLSLPGAPGDFDVDDTSNWQSPNPRPRLDVINYSLLWDLAQVNGSKESRAVGDMYYARHPDKDDPATAFLWLPADVPATPLDEIKPYHYFPDMDIVSWRSSWKPDATCYLFRCGPPLGHAAAAKLDQLKDWEMNCGHVHPDIGAFYMYAKGAYLAVATGYTAEKWTKDHNTLLIDGKGQAADGEYHNDRGFPYANLNQARIDRCYLDPAYGYASGEFGAAYFRDAAEVKLRRSVLMTERWLLVIDDLAADAPHQLTWLCHADAAFQAEGPAFVAHLPQASLAIVPLSADALQPQMGPAIVVAGTAPGKGHPTQRGFQLSLTQAQPAKASRIINLLVPLGPGEKLPSVQSTGTDKDHVQLSLKWPDGKTERVQLDLTWQSGKATSDTTGPATIHLE